MGRIIVERPFENSNDEIMSTGTEVFQLLSQTTVSTLSTPMPGYQANASSGCARMKYKRYVLANIYYIYYMLYTLYIYVYIYIYCN
jgi:hypothetical protein